jgi:type VI secretion system protein VasG
VRDRCTEHESGGRMIDAILTNTLLPQMSGEILGRMLSGEPLSEINVSVRDGDFAYSFG